VDFSLNFLPMTELYSPRLHLREFTLADAADMVALNSDPEVVKYTGDGPFKDLAEAEALIRNYDSTKNIKRAG
jgi:[ribosomal protein S5]-alanine N-acetyltransferase